MPICILGLYLSKTYRANKLLTQGTLSAFFSVLGKIWLLILITSYLMPEVQVLLKSEVTRWSIFVIVIVLTLIERRPEVSIKEKIDGYDVFINIKVGDVIEANQSCVISTNTIFQTDMSIISPKSVQGQFTLKYYDHDTHLDGEINQVLKSANYQVVSELQSRGQTLKKYPVGTVVKVTPRNRTFYLLAVANMNPQGNAASDFNMISDALNRLWQYLGEAGDYEQELLIPVLGTGRSRLTTTREEIIQEIINSFIAATTQKRVCDTLSIVIHSSDFYRFNLEMEDLKHFLIAQCRYARIKRSPGGGTGESL